MKNIINKIKKKKVKLSGQSLVYLGMGFFVLLVLVALIQSRVEIREKQETLDSILVQCEEQQMQNDALSDLLNNSDDEYIERKAREELDYVLPGERVYIVRYGN
ncbi:MAG: septum formation initiator family protein [Clostridia bacterium]|nr:septum formation initiator family protein [Clostridia bacterium]